MTMYGANPEQLGQLGNTLKAQMGAIDNLMSTVSGALAGTTWQGPARDQFEGDWTNTFRGALNNLKSAFEAAGSDCSRRATDLAMVMGAR